MDAVAPVAARPDRQLVKERTYETSSMTLLPIKRLSWVGERRLIDPPCRRRGRR
jgi:hypothetical protein